jgi:hypothetical protein
MYNGKKNFPTGNAQVQSLFGSGRSLLGHEETVRPVRPSEEPRNPPIKAFTNIFLYASALPHVLLCCRTTDGDLTNQDILQPRIHKWTYIASLKWLHIYNII